MGTDLRAHSPRAARLFDLAGRITGQPISSLCAEGPIEQLTATEIAQPAVVTTSLAALAVLEEELDPPAAAVAGHSVGEFAAYAAAGVFGPDAALRLVHARADAMAAACASVDGTMAAVIGLDEDALRAACTDASTDGSQVEVANLNAPGQLVVSGARDAVDRAAARARDAGARRVLPLNVGGPFHSVYMRSAADALARTLDQTRLERPRMPVVLNATGRASQEVDRLRAELAVQVYSPVRWIESLKTLRALGCDRFLEVGPGQVLAGMVRRTLPDVKVASFGALADLDAASALLSA